MNDQQPLPRFRKPPVSEVAIGFQFQNPVLTPVHLGLYYEIIKDRFPAVQVMPPLPQAFETYGSSPPGAVVFNFPLDLTQSSIQPRMWFQAADGFSMIQLQSGKLFFNWRGGPEQNTYPHFAALQSEFMRAADELAGLAERQGLGDLNITQCELVYVNPLPYHATGVPLSEPHRIFRNWTANVGPEWQEPLEDLAYNARYRFDDADGNPFGRLIASLSSGWAPDGSPNFQLELTARGTSVGQGGRDGIVKFHEHAHQAIVRCFAAITTPEMHQLWERYQ